MSRSGHRELDHTADVALEVWADSGEALLGEAARAVVELMTEGRDPGLADQERTIELTGIDRSDLLVQFLNEVLVAALVDGFLATGVREVRWDDQALHAVVSGRGAAQELIAAELKAVTHHEASLRQDEDGLRAVLVIDV